MIIEYEDHNESSILILILRVFFSMLCLILIISILASAHIFRFHISHMLCRSFFSNVDLVDRLIAMGADLRLTDDLGRVALHYAALNGHCDIAVTIVSTNFDVNPRDRQGCTPLMLAAASDTSAK